MFNNVINFISSTNFLLIIVVLAAYNLGSKYIRTLNAKNILERERLIKDTPINQNKETLECLDGLILDIIGDYQLLNLKPKNILYINNDQEKILRDYVVKELDKRIPEILLDKLRLVCNVNYLGDFIGNRIYFAVFNFVLEYNTNSNDNIDQKNK